MGKWLNYYLSPRITFNRLFIEASNNLDNMAALLFKSFNKEAGPEREGLFKQIDLLENKGDRITHQIYLALEKMRFSPFRRKDLHQLASAVDDIADQIQETSDRIGLYNTDKITPAMAQMAACIAAAVLEIKKLIAGIFDISNLNGMLAGCRYIKVLEHEADLIYYRTLADLFSSEKNAIELLKHLDVLNSLETAVNRCKSTAAAIELILINNV